MQRLSFAQVQEVGVVAHWSGTVGFCEADATYLPENKPSERVRLFTQYGDMVGVTFGPGGAKMAEGWWHDAGCTCKFCVGEGTRP